MLSSIRVIHTVPTGDVIPLKLTIEQDMKLNYWPELEQADRSKTVVHSKEMLKFMVETGDDQEVIAELTKDNCVVLTRRNKSEK